MFNILFQACLSIECSYMVFKSINIGLHDLFQNEYVSFGVVIFSSLYLFEFLW